MDGTERRSRAVADPVRGLHSHVRWEAARDRPISGAGPATRAAAQRRKFHIALAHSFDYVANKAYKFGRQGFDMVLSKRIGTREGTSVVVFGGGGVTAQGAVDRVALTTEAPEAEPEPGEEERDYDYGPGTTFGGSAVFERKGRAFFDLAYQGYQIYVVDGVRSNHVLQRFRMDLLIPLHRRLAFGTAGEYFYRKTYFATGGERRDKFPQARIYLAWR